MNTMLTRDDVLLLADALLKAASRHESQGHVTKGRFRYEHDDRARKMRTLRTRLLTNLPTTSPPVVKMANV
jgi:hypothetical protein